MKILWLVTMLLILCTVIQAVASFLNIKEVIDSHGTKKPNRRLLWFAVGMIVISGILSYFSLSSNTSASSSQVNTSSQSTAYPIPSTAINVSPTLPPTDTPTPTPTAVPKPGTLLYQANWSSGMDGWSGGADWKQVSNMLVNDGTGNYGYQDSVVLAPYQPNTANYSVEATIQYVRYGWGFGILARGGGGDGYKTWITTGGTPIWFNVAAITLASQSPSGEYDADTMGESLVAKDDYQIDTAWHTYRFDLKDGTLTFSLDGQKILTTTDTQYLNPGRVGLAVNTGSQIDVKSFQVTVL